MARTREEIVSEMMASMPDTYDKTEGSPFFETQMPAAIQLEQMEQREDKILANAFFETADDEHKELIAKDRANIERKAAVASTGNVLIKGTPGKEVPKGIKVASDVVVFTVKESKIIPESGEIYTEVECDVAGTVGNVPVGAIKDFPVTVSGLHSVTNDKAFDNGYEKEPMSDFSKRYYDKIRNPVISGNEAQYRQWALEVPGVGDAKVKGRSPSRGSVTITIIDASKTAADSALCEKVFSYIEERRMLGADVHVVSAEEVPIAVSLTITNGDHTKEYVELIREKLTKWLAEQAFQSDYISYAMINREILTVQGIIDIDKLLVNGKVGNVQIGYGQVAVAGEVQVEM